MKLTPPKMITFWISVALGLLGLLGAIGVVSAVAAYAFWLRTSRSWFVSQRHLILQPADKKNSLHMCREFSINNYLHSATN